jgi:hypothetical protein
MLCIRYFGVHNRGTRLANLDLPGIDKDQRGRLCERQNNKPMGNIIFKCSRTGMNVQHWLADEPQRDDPSCTYETVVCKACSRLHFINRSTGKLLGEPK